MSPERATRKSASESPETTQKHSGFSAEEQSAMRERAQELKSESRRRTRSTKNRESDVLEKIAEMPEPDRQMALRLHEIVKDNAPALSPKTWYGMPAYALDDKVICFFQAAAKFKTRYATLGFSDTANLDEGDMWSTAFALKELTPDVEERIATLVKRAAS